MIISASRRTDIPSFYSDWFYNRIKEGFLMVRNPMNIHQVSKIQLTTDVVDCIVFWTKNPIPMMKRLEELKDYHYYFQFTITGFGRDIEPSVPDKKNIIIPAFQELSDKIGKEKVIWRYDPIIFTEKYTMDYHMNAFRQIAEKLNGYTEKCVISFVDIYAKNKKNMEGIHSEKKDDEQLTAFAKELSRIARDNNMVLATCSEAIDLEECGIEHNCCIDKNLIERIIGMDIKASKDKNQRLECGCVESAEIGTYNTCKHGCKYCYANYSMESVVNNAGNYDVHSPILCGKLEEFDKVNERKVKSIKEPQMSIFDLK